MRRTAPGTLPPPLSSADADRFFARLTTATVRILLLDYDGTLAPFQVDRDRAFPYPGVREALTAIQATAATRLVIVSGRPVAEIEKLLGLATPPELWGSHGWERVVATGVKSATRLPTRVGEALDKGWEQLVKHNLADRGERKPASLAVHWRGLPGEQIQAIRQQIHQSWQNLGATGNLELQEFDGGLELRARDRDKGFAVRTVLSEAEPDAVIAYLGDDQTDEDAFRALRPQDLGVLVRRQKRPSAARFWLEYPGMLLAFLERWAASER